MAALTVEPAYASSPLLSLMVEHPKGSLSVEPPKGSLTVEPPLLSLGVEYLKVLSSPYGRAP
jgi:hypothetical protein